MLRELITGRLLKRYSLSTPKVLSLSRLRCMAEVWLREDVVAKPSWRSWRKFSGH